MSDRGQRTRCLSRAAALLPPLLLALQLPAALDGLDGVDFALALREYDPGLEQPHPPGYPLYIFLCRAAATLGLGEAAALALPGILASPVLVLAAASAARRAQLGTGAELVAALWTALHPLLLAEGPRAAPDLLGAAAAWGALGLALAQRPAVSGGVLGLALGVRPDLAPFSLLCLALERGARARFVGGLALGAALWLVPFAALAPAEWFVRGAGFARGHFTVWGSSAFAGAGAAAGSLRGLALLASGPAGAWLAWIGARRARWPRLLVPGLVGYSLWVLVGQNLAHARHWLPLVPAAALLGSAGLAALGTARARALAAAAVLALALPALRAAQRTRLDGAGLVAHAVQACGDCTAVYAGPSARLFAHYAPPGFPVYRRSSLAAIRLDLEAWGLSRAHCLATDEIPGVAARGLALGRIGPIGLYRIDAAALR